MILKKPQNVSWYLSPFKVIIKLFARLSVSACILIIIACGKGIENDNDTEYRQYMREFVQAISEYAKGINPGFIIIPQNGIELITESGNEDDPIAIEYLDAIDGVGQEDLLYGYNSDNVATPMSVRYYLATFLDIAEINGVEVLATNYCWDHYNIGNSYEECAVKGYISFAAPERDLNVIPDYPDPIFNKNAENILNLTNARNFLYLLNPESYENKYDFICDLQNTNYDLLIIDAFFEDTSGIPQWYESSEINSLKNKHDGGSRLVIAYMSIGEAESYRYYWNEDWDSDHNGHPDEGAPAWLAEENPNWEGNYKVRYWDPEWQNVITGNDSSYVKHIIDIGFDGVYLDIIDAFEYFED
ncbi:endo alpha-1,4 polygalactosaminidase [bacterium]|nr:endo alpha-1,4 polygalactosaminidase [bacterium]